jgi:hypothetical protein
MPNGGFVFTTSVLNAFGNDKTYQFSVHQKFIHMWLRDMPGKYQQHKCPTVPMKACDFAEACFMLATAFGTSALPPFDGYSRDFLMLVAHTLGYQYIPAWIVKDKSRRIDRSKYLVPEVSIYAIAYLSTLPAPTTTNEKETTNA